MVLKFIEYLFRIKQFQARNEWIICQRLGLQKQSLNQNEAVNKLCHLIEPRIRLSSTPRPDALPTSARFTGCNLAISHDLRNNRNRSLLRGI